MAAPPKSIESGEYMRHYRKLMANFDQSSPIGLHDLVASQLVGSVIADIGCGAGVHSYLLKNQWGVNHLAKHPEVHAPIFIGIDFSRKAIEKLKTKGVFDEVYLSSSDGLPLHDSNVDTAISMENMEHLYKEEVKGAINELCRIARARVIITTPWPENVINLEFLDHEIEEATKDPLPISYEEFLNLAGYIHKSTVLPSSMKRAGFANPTKLNSRFTMSALYVGDPKVIDASKIEVIGLAQRTYHPKADMRDDYLDLLKESKALAKEMPQTAEFRAARFVEARRALSKSWSVFRKALRNQ